MLSKDLAIILPEVILALYAMSALLFAVYFGKDKLSATLFPLTSFIMVILGLWLFFSNAPAQTAFFGAFIDDGFARYLKALLLVGGAIMLMLSQGYLKRLELYQFEFPLLIALASLGMMMMVSAGDLIALYMGLELQSLSLYVVASFHRDNRRSTEAGLKYFVLGALSSGLLLYGASLIYGYSGTTDFNGIASTLKEGDISIGLLTGLVFLCVGLGFKMSAAPFHMWTPDVYEGSPTPVTGFFATAPKIAAAGLFARVLFDGFATASQEWMQIIAFLSLVSMFVGSIAAIGQTNIKRLMAYSSIAHMGFALMGLASASEKGVQALLLYMMIYLVMNIGVFAFILSMKRDEQPIADIKSLGLYAQIEPLKALCMAVLMFSLAGIPPLVGFWGKYFVLSAAIDAGLIWLALLGVIASVIGAFYYLRIIYIMYFGEDNNGLDCDMSRLHLGTLVASALIMTVGIINLFGFDDYALIAAQSLLAG